MTSKRYTSWIKSACEFSLHFLFAGSARPSSVAFNHPFRCTSSSLRGVASQVCRASEFSQGEVRETVHQLQKEWVRVFTPFFFVCNRDTQSCCVHETATELLLSLLRERRLTVECVAPESEPVLRQLLHRFCALCCTGSARSGSG